MSELSLRQIKEEARKDAIARFFSTYQGMIKRLAIVVAISLLLYGVYSLILNNLQAKYSKLLHESLIAEQLGDFEQVKEKLKKIHDAKFAPSNVKSLANLRYGSVLLIENDKENAIKIYEEVANSRTNDDYVRDLGALLASKILISNLNAKNEQKTLKNLKQFTSKSEVLRPYILEQMAIFYIKTKQISEAREILEEIVKTEKITQSLQLRALDLIKIIS
jgi:hypothetical protein